MRVSEASPTEERLRLIDAVVGDAAALLHIDLQADSLESIMAESSKGVRTRFHCVLAIGGNLMARAASPAEALLAGVIAAAVTPPLKAAGFRKSGMSYHRRFGETVQVVNVQVSHSATATEKTFYVNVGIAFDALCALAGLPVIDRPKESDCDDRGTRDRLGALIPGASKSWVVNVEKETARTVTALRRCLQKLVGELETIDNVAAYRGHRWFNRFRPTPANAKVLYLLGDLAGAWQEVRDLATLFTDRQNANQTEWWLDRLCLSGLKSA